MMTLSLCYGFVSQQSLMDRNVGVTLHISQNTVVLGLGVSDGVIELHRTQVGKWYCERKPIEKKETSGVGSCS